METPVVARAHPTPRSAEPAVATAADALRWKALWFVLVGAFMDVLDATVVFLAIPSIQGGLGATDAQVQWILAGYTLAFAATLITGGRLGDAFGRKRVYILGAAGFTAASVGCGLAPSAGVLVAARVAQGALAGLMVPQVLSIIQAGFPAGERSAALGAFGAVLGVGNVAAPLVAGSLLQADVLGLGWRAIFLINLPLGVLALAGAWKFQRESRSARAARLDVGGALLATCALLLLLYPLVQGRELGWPAWTLLAMAGAVPAAALLAWHQRSRVRAGAEPLLPPGLFRGRAFVSGLLVALCLFAGLSSFFLVYSLLVQVGLGISPLAAGLIALPWPASVAAASVASVKLAPRVGRRVIGCGGALMSAGMLAVIAALHAGGAEVSPLTFIPGLALGGLGMGLIAPTLFDFVLASVPPRDAGAASGVLNTVFQVAAALGVAVVGTVFFALLAGGVGPGAEDLPAAGAGGRLAFVAAAAEILWIHVAAFAAVALLHPLLPPRPVAHGGAA